MSDVDRDIANMKCWAVVVLICSIFSFNLAIFITGIVGASQVLCCASSKEQVARSAGCFKCCSMACAIIAALHALGAMILGAVMAGSVDPCVEKLTDSSCRHLDGRRRRLDSAPLGGVAVEGRLHGRHGHVGRRGGNAGRTGVGVGLGICRRKMATWASTNAIAPYTRLG